MSSARDYAAIALEYAQRVVDGSIAACKLTIAACQRQLNDLQRQETPGFPFRYEPDRGARVCRMLELLPHIKGRWKTPTIQLQPWQVFILMTVFSWVWATAAAADPEIREKDGQRRFRTAYTEVPRKNAKSTLTAGVGLYMLGPDGEQGAECYSAATTKDQAKIVFDVARAMAKKTPKYCERFGVEVGTHALTIPDTESLFKALSSEDNSLDGLNIHFASVDELHAHKTRAVYDVLETAAGSRSQSLLWNITTAGTNRAGVCYEVRTYLTKILNGSAADETFFGIIYTIDQGGTDLFQSVRALRELDKLCTCNGVPNTLIEQSWRAACARLVTTATAERVLGSGASITPIDQPARASSAEAATSSGSSIETPSESSDLSASAPSGQQSTPSESELLTPGGATAAAALSFEIRSGEANTASGRPSTTPSTQSNEGDALSATSRAKLYAWITTTSQELFGGSSAASATAQSVFSETLRKVYDAHSRTCGVQRAELADSGFTLLVKTEGDDWTDPKVWAKANPNYGVSVFPDDIARLCRKAQELPSAQPNFLTKRLNVWVNADSPWMDMRRWDACGDPQLSIDQFAGEECFVAIDLASNVDVAARIDLFRKSIEEKNAKSGELETHTHYYAFGRFYVPEDVVEESDNSQYKGWERAGRLIATDGGWIDQNLIQDDLRLAKDQVQIREVAYDPFQATKFATELSAEGFPMVEMGATVLNFSAPMKEIEALVKAGRLHHNGDPVLSWMISNVVCHVDRKDNVFPTKQTSKNKIDGAVALIMAVGRAMHAPPPKVSVYASRGVRSF